MTPKTAALMNEMVTFAREGNDVYPFMFQPRMGRSNTVSAAIRAAKKLGLLVEAGLDGVGKPYYRAALPAATHATTSTVN